MIMKKSSYIRTRVVNTITKKITGHTVGDLASKLLVSAGKSLASEAGKRLALVIINELQCRRRCVTT
jgi:hypothetical protein